jgi:F0F1-type ATP synthase membrane subunit c/vacuolar-type H+-ATPase subunit K
MDKLRAAYRVAVIIGLAMIASLLVYATIVGILEKGTVEIHGTAMAGSQLELIKFVLLGLTVILFFVIRVFNTKFLNAEGEQGKMLDSRFRLTPGVAPEFSRLTTTAIVTYALCEAPAIFGLVLFFIGRNSSDFYLFMLISLFFFAIHFPRFSQWEEWYRKQQGR